MTCYCDATETIFGEKKARRDLRRYRRKGPRGATRVLVEALEAEGIEGMTVLDIGGGIGTIQHELLAAGASEATGVEASAAYLETAREEAERRGYGGRASHRHGDFVQLAPSIEPADVVTLDRVVCCYPDMPALVGLSAERARKLYGLVYPRDASLIRFGVSLVNRLLRIARKPFRAYVHPPDAMDAVVRERGLEPRFHRDQGPVWHVAVYARS